MEYKKNFIKGIKICVMVVCGEDFMVGWVLFLTC